VAGGARIGKASPPLSFGKAEGPSAGCAGFGPPLKWRPGRERQSVSLLVYDFEACRASSVAVLSGVRNYYEDPYPIRA
jgi:hypothetical protein